MAELPLTAVIRFQEFEVNLQTGELRKSGRKLKLSGQPMQVLTILLQRPGQIVTREELQNRLWPDTFVDVDHNLNTAINKIRETLGDSAENPRYLETIPRRGYRFIASTTDSTGSAGEATALDAGAIVPEKDTKPASSLRPRGLLIVRTAAAVGLILLTALAGLVPWRRSSDKRRNEEWRLVSNSPENPIRSVATSPDGKYLAYQDNVGIFLKTLKTGETHAAQWPQNVAARVNGWFPDGSHLLVTRDDGPKPALWRLSVFGGAPTQLIEDASGGCVSPDGSQIVFHRYKRAGDLGSDSLWTAHADGSAEAEIVAEGQGHSSLGGLAWSPDSTKVALVRASWSYTADVGTVEVTDPVSRNTQTILTRTRIGAPLTWLHDGRILYVETDARPNDGDSNIWAITVGKDLRPVGSPIQVTNGPGWTDSVSAADDGRIILFLKNYARQQIYVGALSSDGHQIVSHKRLANDESENVATSWTADSQSVLIMSNRNGRANVYKQPLNGSLPEALVLSSDNESQPRLSPDGTKVLYLSVPPDPSPEAMTTIMAVSVAGGAPRKILSDRGIWNLQCSRTLASVCMYSNQHGPQMTAFRFDINDGKSTEVFTNNPIRNWSLSPDGNLIAICGTDAQRSVIQLRSTVTGQAKYLGVTGRGALMNIDWAADGKTLLVTVADAARKLSLLRVGLDGHVSVLLDHTDSEIIAAIPSPDGRSLAIDEFHLGPTTIWGLGEF